MVRRLTGIVGVVVVALMLVPTAARASLFQEYGGLASNTNGIVLGPDGNVWVVEEGNGSVIRATPSGGFLARYTVGADPTLITSGAGGRVWVAVTGADKLVWFDALSASPTAHDVPTSLASDCGPVGLASGGGRLFFSMPTDGLCGGGADTIASVADDGSDLSAAVAGRGQAFDLEVAGGKLYAPDFGGDVIRRMSLTKTLPVDAPIAAPAGSAPDGIAADGAGNLWVTAYSSGQVLRFPASQTGGSATVLTPSGGALTHPFGIVAGTDGAIYATGEDTANLVRIKDGSFAFYALPGGGAPFQVINGTDGDLFVTDRSQPRVLRFVNSAPRASTGPAGAAAATVVSATAGVNPRGNETQVTFQYGTSTAYGQGSAPVTLPAGASVIPVNASISGLAPSTTYHVRVHASNAEGSTDGADVTVTTPAGPAVDADGDGVSPPLDCDDHNPARRPGAVDIPADGIDQDCNGTDAGYPLLSARTTFAWAFGNGFTMLTKLRIISLTGGETAVITCKGKSRRCPFAKRTYRHLKKGTRKFDASFRKRRLKPGTLVVVRVTRPATIGSITSLTIRRGKDPRIVRRCLRPGSSKPKAC